MHIALNKKHKIYHIRTLHEKNNVLFFIKT